ncbi:hypothetical protein KBD59_00470 [Candidatus Gracilibacteria bacterium]|nr:hypothetical protein [Candidatus Gracilibacteria bacterium]
MYEQKQSALWWTRNPKTIIYFLREFTGVVIAAYAIYFVIFALKFTLNDEIFLFLRSSHFYIASIVTLIASLIHTVTWLWVTAQVTPFQLPKKIQILLFIGLMLTFLCVSALIIYFYGIFSGNPIN